MQGTQKAHGFYTMLVVKEYILLEAIANGYIYMEGTNSSHKSQAFANTKLYLSIQTTFHF